MAPRQQWFETLRLSIQQEHGKGWSIWEVGATKRNPVGRCRLTRIYEDRTRSSVVLHLEWKANNATAILSAVGQLRTLMDERNLSLQDANKLNTELLNGPQVDGGEFAGWAEVGERFLKTKAGLRSSTLADLTTRVERTLEALKSRPCPRDGGTLMQRYADKFFAKAPREFKGDKQQHPMTAKQYVGVCHWSTAPSIQRMMPGANPPPASGVGL